MIVNDVKKLLLISFRGDHSITDMFLQRVICCIFISDTYCNIYDSAMELCAVMATGRPRGLGFGAGDGAWAILGYPGNPWSKMADA